MEETCCSDSTATLGVCRGTSQIFMMAQHSFGVLITWEMPIISFMCMSTRCHRTGFSWQITSSMSSPHSTLSHGLCSNRISAFRVETLSGNAFDLLWAGPNATNVPKEAVVVDNFSPDIVYSTPSMWYRVHDVRYYRKSLSYTIQPGASLSFTFDGVAIWYDCVSYT